MQEALMLGKGQRTQGRPSKSAKLSSLFNALIHILVYFLLSLSLVSGSNMLSLAAIAISGAYCVFADLNEILYLLVGISLFEAVFTVGGDNAWFVLLLIFVGRICLKHLLSGKSKIAIIPAVSFVVMFALELALDFFNGSMGQLLVNLVILIFVFVVFSNLHLFSPDAFRIIFDLSMSFFAVLFYLLRMYGGFFSFIKLFMSASYAYRFGHAYGDTVGGAMAIPLYTSMIIACSLAFLLLAKNKRAYQRVFVVAASLVALLFGAMTVSRSFYLGLFVALLALVIFRSSGGRATKYLLIAILLAVALVLVFSQSGFISKILENLQIRLDAGVDEGTGGRTDIWIACFEYILKNPLALIFGLGMANYTKIGASLGLYFSAGAHNLLIDFIMSFGLLGLVIMLVLIVSAIRKIVRNTAIFNKHSLIPAITYLFFAMTALRTTGLKTWMFMLVAFMFIIALNERKTV